MALTTAVATMAGWEGMRGLEQLQPTNFFLCFLFSSISFFIIFFSNFFPSTAPGTSPTPSPSPAPKPLSPFLPSHHDDDKKAVE